MTHPVSVLIPAHNEEAVLDRCLRALVGAAPDDLQVVVVCNGCVDETAERARSWLPADQVVEIPEASKIQALNAGDKRLSGFPRFYVDADVELSLAALRRVGEELERPGVLCAAPTARFELTDRPWPIRWFYEARHHLSYLNSDVAGACVYALSEAGRMRFDEFPEIVADDLFVQEQFRPEERRVVEDAICIVHPPRTLRGLLRIRQRTYRGMAELRQTHGLGPAPSRRFQIVTAALRSPWVVPKLVVYVAVNLVALSRSRLVRRRDVIWERDESSRGPSEPAEKPSGGGTR